MSSSVQGHNADYELHTLGWKAFQDLCVTITRDIWGQTVQSFFDSNDGGRDGAFHGVWEDQEGECYVGDFVVQCKHTASPDKQLKLADLDEEIKKAKKLVSESKCQNYFLITNLKLTGNNDALISKAFTEIGGLDQCKVYGKEWISRRIRESKRLRMLVPRVYGLGDLSQIIEGRAYDQATSILESIGNDLNKFVVTEAYRRSANALYKHGFVLLLGEPACGKSTIAAALSLSSLDNWDCSTLKVNDADSFEEKWNPNEPTQLFWVDDCFGATQLDKSLVEGWNRRFLHLDAAIKKGARFIFTSRYYIYHGAREYLKETSLPVMRESQVVINVQDISKVERRQILYNHVKLGDQSFRYKARIKDWLEEIALHPKFTPEIARRIGSSLFTQALELNKHSLLNFVNRPMEFLIDVIQTIDVESKSVLALIFMNNGTLNLPLRMNEREEHAIQLIGGSKNGIRVAINSLQGSLLQTTVNDGGHKCTFKHPTIRDAFASMVAEDVVLMDIYLAGVSTQSLFNEISCGNMNIKGVKLIVPSSRFDFVLSKFSSGLIDSQKNKVNRFLSERCTKEFISCFIEKFPTYISRLHASSSFFSQDEDLIVRLYESDQLPEKDRVRIVAELSDIVVEEPRVGFYLESIRGIMENGEFQSVVNRVRDELVPNIDNLIDDLIYDYDSDEDPDAHFMQLRDELEVLPGLFENHASIKTTIEEAVASIEHSVDELRSRYEESGYSSVSKKPDPIAGQVNGIRSIFDDVDC